MTQFRSSPCSIRLVLVAVVATAATACQKPSEAPRPTPAPVASAARSATSAVVTPPAEPPAARLAQSAQPKPPVAATPPRATATDLTVHRVEVATAVVEREPVTEVPLRAGQDRVYAFLDVANDSSAPAELVVTFERSGSAPVGLVSLTVPAHQPRWRTWAFTRGIRAPGEWTVRVRTASGADVVAKQFEVKPPSPVASDPRTAPSDA